MDAHELTIHLYFLHHSTNHKSSPNIFEQTNSKSKIKKKLSHTRSQERPEKGNLKARSNIRSFVAQLEIMFKGVKALLDANIIRNIINSKYSFGIKKV